MSIKQLAANVMSSIETNLNLYNNRVPAGETKHLTTLAKLNYNLNTNYRHTSYEYDKQQKNSTCRTYLHIYKNRSQSTIVLSPKTVIKVKKTAPRLKGVQAASRILTLLEGSPDLNTE